MILSGRQQLGEKCDELPLYAKPFHLKCHNASALMEFAVDSSEK